MIVTLQDDDLTIKNSLSDTTSMRYISFSRVLHMERDWLAWWQS